MPSEIIVCFQQSNVQSNIMWMTQKSTANQIYLFLTSLEKVRGARNIYESAK